MKCTCGIEHADWVPAADVATEKARADQAAADLAAKSTDYAAKLAEWDAANKDTAAKLATLDTTTKALADLQGREVSWTLERSIMGAGILDAEGIDTARMFYERLPAEGRPPVEDWLGARDALPRAVATYFPAAPGEAPPPPLAKPPAVNAGVKPPPAPGATLDATAISSMKGAEYAANRSTILASLGMAPPPAKA